MERFKGKYRIESNRLHGWDYSSDGLYFITITTAGRECYFGEISNGKMKYNDYGKIACDEWYKSFEIRHEFFLDEFILMPNHLHAIIVLDNKTNDNCANGKRSNDGRTARRDARPCVSTTTQSPITPQTQNAIGNKNDLFFQRKPKSISSFVAGYKSAVISEIDNYIDENELNMHKFNRNNPLWQANYHDHIIRDDTSYRRIKNYIINNPKNWDEDKFFNTNFG